jgi:hypothetical protein
MNRGASAAVQAEWAKAQNAPAHLVELQFDVADGGTVYVTDSYRTISYGGNNYTALGALLDFAGVSESVELRIADAVLTLQGVDQTYIAAILQRQYLYRRLLVYKAFMGTADVLIVDPFAIHDGRLDEPKIDEDPDSGKCIVQLRSHDQFADFERVAGRHTNPNDQALWFPNDRAFDQIAALAAQQQKFTWGRSMPQGPSVPFPGMFDQGEAGFGVGI